MRPDGVVAVSAEFSSSNLYGGIKFPDSADGHCQFSIPGSFALADGNLTGMRFRFTTESANGGSPMVDIRVRMGSYADFESVAAATLDENLVTSVAATAYLMTPASLQFPTPIPFTREDTIIVRIDREATSGSDNAVGNWFLFGIILEYTSYGPNFAADDLYDVSPPFNPAFP
jgi:hypothetical protein